MSLAEALNLIYVDGSGDSNLKKAFIKKKIKKESRKNNWEDTLLKTMDKEWQWRLCNARLALGHLDWKGWGFRNPRNGQIPYDYPYWDGTLIRKLLLLGEQGIGDEVMFASMFNELLTLVDDLTIECDHRLVNIFRRSFPTITFIPSKDFTKKTDDHFDAMYLMGDLLPLFRRQITDFKGEPYLIPDPDLIKKYKDYQGKVGVSWVGRQGRINELKTLGDISLQYDEVTESLESPEFDLKNDLEDLFACVSNLARVVCVPTSVAHFAGALGVPVDVIFPKRGMDHGGFEKVNNALNWRWTEKFNRGLRSVFHDSVKFYPSLSFYLKNKSHE